MKQYLTFMPALAIAITSFSQPQVDKAKEHLKANHIAEAKSVIDEFLKDPANQKNSDAWYIKSKVYVAIAEDASLSKQYPSSRMDAFKALKIYTETDTHMMIALQIDGYKPINDIYTGFYTTGANSFNSKSYEIAYDNFVNAIMISSFMTKKGWINLALDTNSVLYAGVSAEKLSRQDDAVRYYGQLAEGRVKGEGFVEIYKWVANYHFEKKDLAQAKKFTAIGREVYPNDPFWTSLELDMTRETQDKNALWAQYDKAIAAEPANHLYHYNYAVELYQAGYNIELSKRPANGEALVQKAAEHVSKALQIKPDYSRAQLFAGQIQYNIGVDFLNQAKTTTDPTEKTNLKSKAMTKFDEALPYFFNVDRLMERKTKLSIEEKSDLKEALDLTITIYEQKGDKEKIKEYETKFNSVDKK